MRWIKLIPVKILVKYLPEILAFILTKVLTYLLKKYPHKAAKVVETTKEITIATVNAIEAAKDGIITKQEIRKQRALWKEVFI